MRPGTRVAWSDGFIASLASNPRAHAGMVRSWAAARGTVVLALASGDVIVQWDDCDAETRHPPARIQAVPHVMTSAESYWADSQW